MQSHDAARAQYETPTPGPPIGTPTAGPPLPYTGMDAFPVMEAGAFLLVAGVVLAVILKRWA